MTSQLPKRRKVFVDALHDFIREYDDLDSREIIEALQEVSEDFDSVSSTVRPPVTCLEVKEQKWEAHLHYATRQSLSVELPALLDLRGVCLITEDKPPLMQWITLRIGCSDSKQTVELQARVVQHTEDGVALEIKRADQAVREKLHGLISSPVQPGQSSTTLHGKPVGAGAGPRAELAAPSPQASTINDKKIELNSEAIGRWRLEQMPLDRILLDLARRRGYGVLEIVDGERTSQLVCYNHYILEINRYPRQDGDTLEGLLLESGNIDQEQFASSRALARQHNISVGDALVQLNAITASQLLLSLKARIKFLLERLWKPRGEASFHVLSQPPGRYTAPPVSIPARVFAYALNRYEKLDRDQILVACERYNQRFVTTATPLPFPIESLEFDDKRQRFFNALQDDPRVLRDVLQISSLSHAQTLALVLSLDHLGLLRLTGSPADERERAQRSADIDEVYNRLQSDDYFTMMGLHWSAYDQEIQRAFHALSQRFAQSSAEDLAEAVQRKVQRIRESITEAYEAIRNPARRAKYRESLVDSYSMENAINMFKKQAETAKMRRDIDSAVDACCRIVELDPDDGDARQDLKTLRPLKLWANSQRR
ncbi:MAG: hypothetical protein H0U74_17410 [Bradymonadaceae bacterium]|nr:hypothetical protein [Lujinxingiaceae bacterium]